LDVAQPYHRNPEKIANKVYADRMGNGNEASGEGFKYRGRGLIQLTGKDNYRACGEALGVDLLDNPDLVSSPQYAALSAGWFWDKNKLNQFADANDMTGLTKRINGGTHGLDDRVARTQTAIDVLMA
jgi:putative chitinase